MISSAVSAADRRVLSTTVCGKLKGTGISGPVESTWRSFQSTALALAHSVSRVDGFAASRSGVPSRLSRVGRSAYSSTQST